MTKIMNSDDDKEKAAEQGAVEPTNEDTEGHMYQPDLGTSRHLAKSRSAEIDRAVRERQQQKEARPNRR